MNVRAIKMINRFSTCIPHHDLWNGVIPAWMEWVTAQDPADREVSPVKQAVALNGFFGVLGTGRRVPAGRRQER